MCSNLNCTQARRKVESTIQTLRIPMRNRLCSLTTSKERDKYRSTSRILPMPSLMRVLCSHRINNMESSPLFRNHQPVKKRILMLKKQDREAQVELKSNTQSSLNKELKSPQDTMLTVRKLFTEIEPLNKCQSSPPPAKNPQLNSNLMTSSRYKTLSTRTMKINSRLLTQRHKISS
jgi:hypothetical protein